MKKTTVLFAVLMYSLMAFSQGQITTNLKTTWVGNTFNGPKWVQEWIRNMKVMPDGTVYTVCDWDEGVGGARHGAFKDCDVLPDKNVPVNSQMATDKAGKTWTIMNFYGRFSSWNPAPVPTGASAPYIKCSDGRTITDIADPSAVAVDNLGLLMVADNGPDQDIKYYNISGTGTPPMVKTFGDKGGVLSGTPGEIKPLKFHGIRGLGTDSLGNIWVGNSGWPMQQSGTDLRKFAPDGTPLCNLLAKIFVKSGDADPDSVDQIYLTYEHMSVDYDGPTPGKWIYKATTMDPFKYPDDFRVGGSSLETTMVRRINGKKYLFLTNMYAEFLAVYRFDGNIAVPAAVFCVGWDGQWMKFPWQSDKRPTWDVSKNPTRRWMWRDNNGDGQVQSDEFSVYDLNYPYNSAIDVTGKGDVTIGGRHLLTFPTNGLDQNGVPNYSVSTMTDIKSPYETPEDGGDMTRIKYLDKEDIMYFGCQGSFPDFTTLIKYSNWSKNPTKEWTVNLGFSAGAFTADEKYIYVAGYAGSKYTSKPGEFDVLDASTGNFVGYFLPGAEVGFQSGSIDLRYAIQTTKRPNGERLILIEEDWKGKVLIYNWKVDTTDIRVDLLSPKPESIYEMSQPIILRANVTKVTSAIDSVQFIIDRNPVATIVNAPYETSWSADAKGYYKVFVRVFSNGKIVESKLKYFQVTDGKPLVQLTSPGEGLTYTIFDTVEIRANVQKYNTTINKVSFYIDDNLVSTTAFYPYTYLWTKPAPGNRKFTAVATYNNIDSLTSEPVNIIVIDSLQGTFVPTKDTLVSQGANVKIGVDISAFKTMTKFVIFYANNRTRISDTLRTTSDFIFQNIPAGAYSLKAVLTLADDRRFVLSGPTVSVAGNVFDCGNTGFLNDDIWNNVTGGIATVPVNSVPGKSTLVNIFEGPLNTGNSDYGQRITGYICPPQTGKYVFYITSDDNSALYMQFPDSAGMTQIANLEGWTCSRCWGDSRPSVSDSITLEAGKPVFVQAIMKQGGGGDNLAVGWRLPDGTMERPIPGNRTFPVYNPLTVKNDVKVHVSTANLVNSMYDSIQITATVTKGLDEVGNVRFYEGKKLLAGSFSGGNNAFSIKTKLAVGTHSIYAVSVYKKVLGFNSDTLRFTVINTTGINVNPANEEFVLSPNPLTAGVLNVTLPEGSKDLSIYDITGKLIYQKVVTNNVTTVASDIFKRNGVYLVSVLTSDKKIVRKLIVNK